MEALDSPKFAPAVQIYKQLRKIQTVVVSQTTLAQVQSSKSRHKKIVHKAIV